MCTESYFWSFYLWEMFEFSCPLPPYLTYPISPTVNILKHHVLLGIINEPILTHYQLRPIIYPYFISIYLIVFLFRIPSYVTHYIIYCFPYLPISSDCFSELPCFWRLWELWAFLTWYFGEWPTIWMYVMLYSDYKVSPLLSGRWSWTVFLLFTISYDWWDLAESPFSCYPCVKL